MYYVEFVASENVSGDVELDLDTAVDHKEAKAIAEKEIARMYPEYDNIEVLSVKELD